MIKSGSKVVDEQCLYCLEPVGERRRDDSFAGISDVVMTADGPRLSHRACSIRNVVGSVAHQEKRCSCYGGTSHDEEFASARDAAIAAARRFCENEMN